jgi:hypothetical protein
MMHTVPAAGKPAPHMLYAAVLEVAVTLLTEDASRCSAPHQQQACHVAGIN